MSSGDRYCMARKSMLPSGTSNCFSPIVIFTSLSYGRNNGPGLDVDMTKILMERPGIEKAAAGETTAAFCIVFAVKEAPIPTGPLPHLAQINNQSVICRLEPRKMEKVANR